jgi:phosphoglycolate phosphatase
VNNIRNILFDLDGTLTDPKEGITGCIRYALERLSQPCPSTDELASFIGPPLRETFASICIPVDDETLVERAVALFRERFSTIGLYENQVYEGVPEMLSKLRPLSYRLFVATSKPEIYARKILDHFSLASHFVEIHGNELNGRLDDKADLLAELIEGHGLVSSETLMVGDRKHDIIAAQRTGVLSLGVTYGYGSREELEEAGADFICDSPADIVERVGKIGSSTVSLIR